MKHAYLAPAFAAVAACQATGKATDVATVAPPVPPPTVLPSTPPPPMPPIPFDADWLLALPVPAWIDSGDPAVDAYRRQLAEEGDPAWRPIMRRLLADVRADPSIIARYDAMRAIDTPADYVAYYVTPERIAAGRALYKAMGGKDPTGDGTPLELKLALWGAASDFGQRPDTDLLTAMVNLGAHDRLRMTTPFPIHEAALLVVERTVDRAKLRGYDSGRMGDTQTTPDMYARLKRDGDGDGVVDIWDDRADILANLWIDRADSDVPLLVAVKPIVIDPNDPARVRLGRALGQQAVSPTYFERLDGKPWTSAEARWSGLYHEPFGKAGPAFLISRAALLADYHNPYNRGYEIAEHHGYALAIALLGEAIAGRAIPDLGAYLP